jgi:hypothetical protein
MQEILEIMPLYAEAGVLIFPLYGLSAIALGVALEKLWALHTRASFNWELVDSLRSGNFTNPGLLEDRGFVGQISRRLCKLDCLGCPRLLRYPRCLVFWGRFWG